MLCKPFPSLDEPLSRGDDPWVFDLLINARARLESAGDKHLLKTFTTVLHLTSRRLAISLHRMLDQLEAAESPAANIVCI